MVLKDLSRFYAAFLKIPFTAPLRTITHPKPDELKSPSPSPGAYQTFSAL